MLLVKLLKSSNGAMFGMDARIALFIFSSLSIIAGVTIVNIGGIYGKGIAKELENIGQAVEAIQNDIQGDLHSSLATNNDTNAFEALFNRSELLAANQPRWLGPYIRHTSATHPKYGSLLISKFEDDHSTACSVISNCYNWVRLTAVPIASAEHLNEIFDGTSEVTPKDEGRLQWTGATGNVEVFFRVSQVLNIN